MHRRILFISMFSACLMISSWALAEGEGGFRFVVMGCAHLGRCGYEKIEPAIEKIKEYKPDFVLFLGGMVDAGTEEPLEAVWHKYDEISAKLGVPVYDVPSDCTLNRLYVPKDKADLMEKCFLDRYKRLYYSFEYKNNLFIALDARILSQGAGVLFERQLDFLKSSLIHTSKYNNVFIFLHRSLWLENNNKWQELVHPLINGKVKFVFGSQKHYLDVKSNDDVVYITTGTPPCYPSLPTPKLTVFNFLIVEAMKDKVSVGIVPISPIPIENLGIENLGIENLGIESLDTISHLALKKRGISGSVLKPSILMSYEREIFLAPERVVKALRIKPGMEILDLGAGTGFFAFRFADSLKGTGKVFATEMDPRMIKYVENKIKESGYKNVFPVFVNPRGVDPFYKQHCFDIIFFSEGYQYLRDPEEYFRELRPSLKEGGSLYIIHPKNVYDFTEIEVGDFKNLVKILASQDKDFPVIQKLDSDARYFIRNWRGEEVPLKISSKIVGGLNRMLLDRWFLYDLMDYFAGKGIAVGDGEWSAPIRLILSDGNRDMRLIKWLFVNLDADGVFDKKGPVISKKSSEELRKLNKILLCNILDLHRIESIQGEFVQPIYVKKESIISTMAKAGYEFVRGYDFLPINDFLEFKRKY